MASTDIIMPQMGESIAEGTIVKWLKKPGDKVKRDEPLFEISTDKVDAEIPSPAEGVLAEIKVPEGQTVEVNVVVGTIADSMAASDGAAKPAAPAAPAATAAAAPKPAAPAAPAAPTAAAPAPAAKATPTPQRDGGVATKQELQQTRSTPVVRKIAAEHGIDIAQVAGTGISGRVTKEDLLQFIEAGGPAVGPTPGTAPAAPAAPAAARAAAPAAAAAAPVGAPSVHGAPVFPAGQNTVVEPMSLMRKKIAEHMVMSKRTSAHVHTIYEIDCSNILNTRKKVQDEFVRTHGQKLTITPFVIKAAIESLRAVPVVNASVDGDNVVYKRDVNIGCAVALDWGLIVPVMHRADELSLVGINNRLADLANRARNKQLKPDEVQGGTFTITNPGIYGSVFGTPIINQPQLAILGMGMIEKRVKVTEDNAIVIKPMMYVCLSYDHRVIDGAVADQFLIHLKKTLETADFRALL